VAFSGEAGYQADLLMPGLRWKTVLVYSVDKYPWIQFRGESASSSRKSAALCPSAQIRPFKKRVRDFSDLRTSFSSAAKGVQRPVLPPGSLVPFTRSAS